MARIRNGALTGRVRNLSAMRCLAALATGLLALAAGCGSGGSGDSQASTRASTTPAPPPVSGPTLAAAGDIACPPGGQRTSTQCRQADTAKVLASLNADVVAPLGDLQYDFGTLREWRTGGFAPTWGTFKSRMRPAVGNHEYGSGPPAGYMRFFGSRVGPPGKYWYSYELGSWHVVVLNSNCSIVGCGAGGAQDRWLRADLARHRTTCTLAYWHHPRFSSGLHGNDSSLAPLWRTLERAGADLVLSGHDHSYERFGPQTSTGRASGNGIVEFVVGTGGRNNYPIFGAKPNSRVRRSFVFGVLELTLGTGQYGWRFVPVKGLSFTDRGVGRCH
jgi:3',5'-cyclic AMP phosphodiesterase CpdA